MIVDWKQQLHKNTVQSYEHSLFTLLRGLRLSPTELVSLLKKNIDSAELRAFLSKDAEVAELLVQLERGGDREGIEEARRKLTDKIETRTEDLSKQIETLLTSQEALRYSRSHRNMQMAALKNFLLRNRIPKDRIFLDFKIKGKRASKPELTWDEAQRIINLAAEEWRPVFQVMLHGALDMERFVEINTNSAYWRGIQEQLSNPTRDYVRIDLEGRKNVGPFYVLLPREVARLIPARNAQGELLRNKQSIMYNWKVARKRAGFLLERKGFGPHNLRSGWEDKALKAGLPEILIEHQVGHQVDPENYKRVQKDEAWVVGEFRRCIWGTKEVASKDEVAKLSEDIVLTSALAKLTAMGWNADALTEGERERAYRYLAEKFTRRLPEKIQTMIVGPEEMKHYIEALNPALRTSRPRGRLRKRGTARNGGSPFETRIVSEAELVGYLDDGWDLIKELRNGKIVIRQAIAD